MNIMAHMIAALFAIITFALPLVGLTLGKLNKNSLISRVSLILTILRLQNVMLLVSVVSGFLMMGGFYFNWWVTSVLVLAIIYGGVLSMVIKALKNLKANAESNIPYQGEIKKFLNTSLIASLIVIAIIGLKVIY